MTTFAEMGLPESLIHTLQHMQFNEPTPIQEQAIPLALQGQDILGSAQTGTGKTGAFGIPLVARILSNPNSSALVMTPTRELATQVMMQLQALLGKQSKVKTALLIGGDPMPKQLTQLRNHPRIIVGTPGRINDHLQRKSLRLQDTDFLVLDETDRMLDMGFTIQISSIIEHMADNRQTLLFSATLPKNIVRISDKYLNNPARVAVHATSSPATKIKQETLHVKDADKYSQLLTQLIERKGSVIMFVKTKYGTERMAKKLATEGHTANAIHGDLRQTKRDRVIKDFRHKKYRILVATDVAARGLDIPHIEHVINYDLPQCPEDYIHRIGRTARAGAEGEALNLVSPAEKGKWNAIERLLDPNAEHTAPQKSTKKKRPKNKRKDDKRKGENSKWDKPKWDKPKGDKPKGNKPKWDKPKDEKTTGDKPKWDKSKGDKPKGHKPKGDNPKWEKPKGDKRKNDKPKWDKPKGKTQKGNKSTTQKNRKPKPTPRPKRRKES